MTTLQSEILAAQRRCNQQLADLKTLVDDGIIPEAAYWLARTEALKDCAAAIAFAHVVAEWEAAPIVHPVEGDSGSRTS